MGSILDIGETVDKGNPVRVAVGTFQLCTSINQRMSTQTILMCRVLASRRTRRRADPVQRMGEPRQHPCQREVGATSRSGIIA